MVQPVHFRAVVERVERHDVNIASYRLRSDRQLPRFTPGQFIHLTIDDYDPATFWPESRVFSVANAVVDRRTVSLTVSRQGNYTSRILDEVATGSTVWGKGPYGEFSVGARQGFRRAVLIAGGTGITPFCAFMDAALSTGTLPLEEVALYYGAKRSDFLIYRSLADRCAAQFPGFHARYYAEQRASDDGPEIELGALNVATIVATLGDIRDAGFYLSGPKAMIDSFRMALVDEWGVARDRVLIDAWE